MNKSVCFTGHRTIAEDKEKLSARLYALLERLVTEKKAQTFTRAELWGGTLSQP